MLLWDLNPNFWRQEQSLYQPTTPSSSYKMYHIDKKYFLVYINFDFQKNAIWHFICGRIEKEIIIDVDAVNAEVSVFRKFSYLFTFLFYE